ncbi:endonuclease I [Lentzea atacamensis]|uniref:Endonuclease I n=1 Tax=Lentzea atacamensis TaxID=531938 RepID=A0A316HPS1_9PSEU|nr:endonuclease I [Lentzea atacamensis]
MARWSPLALIIGLLAAVGLYGSTAASAAAPLTVAQAISQQNGSSATVSGYVVGQPTATNTVVRSNYPSDYALALADSGSETGTSRMIYVQIPTAFRASWGLRSNPSLLGRRIDVTGSLSSYFSHPGLVSSTAFAFTSATPTSSAPPTSSTTTPPACTGYYAAACNKTGSALKTALNNIIRDQTKLSYEAVWDALKVTDEDPNNSNNVILLYSGRSQPKSTNGGGADDWNREHVWAKSHGDFGTATGPGTDIHHLRPEDVSVNAARGNLDFDNGGSAVSEASGSFADGDSFEPRDAVKGDVARMLFYMAVRYEGTDGFANLELNNSVSNGTAPYHGKLSVLLQWHAEDPVDAFEQRRNKMIYENYQRNRNPFIDHPEWASLIWS